MRIKSDSVNTIGAFLSAVFLFLLTGGTAQANLARDTGDQFTMDINISGTVVVTGSCDFVNQSPEVDFGAVEFNTSNNTLEGDYTKTLPVNVKCEGEVNNPRMRFEKGMAANGTYQGTSVLLVNTHSVAKSKLGIRLLVEGKPHNLDDEFTIDVTNQPTLQMDLVQLDSGSDFVNGDTFTANCMFVIVYD